MSADPREYHHPSERSVSDPTCPTCIDVTEHQRLIHWVLRRRGYYRLVDAGLVDEGDLIQQGYLGLLRAEQTYDAERGAWSTFAALWIYQSVNRWVQDRSRTVRIPVCQQNRRRAAGERVHPIVKSLNATINHDDDDDDTTLGDTLAADGASPEDEADDRERRALLAKIVSKAKLGERERRVIDLRARGVTLDATADELGVTRERVRQIEAGALRVLRRAAGVPPNAPHMSLAEPKLNHHRLETKVPCQMQQTQPASASAT